MFRLIVPLKSRSRCLRQIATAVRFSAELCPSNQNVNVQQPRFCERRKSNPSEWELIGTCTEGYPGISGVQFHKKGAPRGDSPWPPEGMTTAEILAVSGAKEYWGTIAEVEAYLLYMEQVLQEDGDSGELL